MYHPNIHRELARERQADFMREAKREQLAALARRNSKSSSGSTVLEFVRGLSFSRKRSRKSAALRPAPTEH